MENAIQAAKRLKDGLAHHDHFGAMPDDAPIYIMRFGDDTLYELPYEDGQFALGDLRDLLSYFTEQGLI